MTRCSVDEAEKANDPPDRLQDYASPDRHQFAEEQVEIDFDKEDTNKKVKELSSIFTDSVDNLEDEPHRNKRTGKWSNNPNMKGYDVRTVGFIYEAEGSLSND